MTAKTTTSSAAQFRDSTSRTISLNRLAVGVAAIAVALVGCGDSKESGKASGKNSKKGPASSKRTQSKKPAKPKPTGILTRAFGGGMEKGDNRTGNLVALSESEMFTWAETNVVRVIERGKDGWKTSAKTLVPMKGKGKRIGFGCQIATDGEFVAVLGLEDYGRVDMYARGAAGAWVPKQLLSFSSSAWAQRVAMDKGTLVAGGQSSSLCHAQQPCSGFVRILRRDSSGQWGSTQQLNGDGKDSFGKALAIEDGVLVVGAPEAGNAYVFTRDDKTGKFGSRQLLSAGAKVAGFGKVVAVSGKRIVVGAPAYKKGSVFVFLRQTDGAFKLETRLFAKDPKITSWGSAVGLSGDTLVVGGTVTDMFRRDPKGQWAHVKQFAHRADVVAVGKATFVAGDRFSRNLHVYTLDGTPLATE